MYDSIWWKTSNKACGVRFRLGHFTHFLFSSYSIVVSLSLKDSQVFLSCKGWSITTLHSTDRLEPKPLRQEKQLTVESTWSEITTKMDLSSFWTNRGATLRRRKTSSGRCLFSIASCSCHRSGFCQKIYPRKRSVGSEVATKAVTSPQPMSLWCIEWLPKWHTFSRRNFYEIALFKYLKKFRSTSPGAKFMFATTRSTVQYVVTFEASLSWHTHFTYRNRYVVMRFFVSLPKDWTSLREIFLLYQTASAQPKSAL